MVNAFNGKKILILGLGLNRGGVGSAKFFAKQQTEVRVTDLKTQEQLKPSLRLLKNFHNITYILGEHRFEDIDWADIIIKNPSIKPDNPYLQYAVKNGKRVETDMGIFLQYVDPEQIIGITGTKGKSTTASLIYEILKKSGTCRAVFAGNIGKSVLDTIPRITKNTLVVLEVSSFQLEAYAAHKVSPHRAVITNIFPDHLNYYSIMKNYIKSKQVIEKYQTRGDSIFIKKGDPVTDRAGFLQGKGEVHYFSNNDLPKNFSPFLLGEHNKDNIAAAISVAKTFGIPEKDALTIAKRFRGVEFRLQKIGEYKGVKIYNDSAATNPDSTIQALKTYPNSILICGGMNKGLDYEDLARAIDNHAKKVFMIKGDATQEILQLLWGANWGVEGDKHTTFSLTTNANVKQYTDLKELLIDVRKEAGPGDTILFSPGATSFNLFQNEFDRGKKFNKAVRKIFGKLSGI